MIDRHAQNILAQKLYANDPERLRAGDDACWLAACFVAYALLTEEYTAEEYKFFMDHYGSTVVGA